MTATATPTSPFGFDDLRGRRVLITGASSGIGAAIAAAFGAVGAHVGIQYHRGEAAADQLMRAITQAGGHATCLKADLSDPAAYGGLARAAIEQLGGVDILINNAGSLVERRAFEAIDDALFDSVFDLNVRAVAGLTSALVPALRQSGQGVIINTSSVAARNGGGPGSLLYAAAKGAINTLTLGLAKELGPLGIRANVVSPGVVVTPFHDGNTTDEALDRVRAMVPLGRLGLVEDCVGAFLFLASPSLSGYISGAVIEISGGRV